MMLLTLDCSERTVLTDGVPRSAANTCSSLTSSPGEPGQPAGAFCRASWPTTFADSLHTWRHGSDSRPRRSP